MTIETQQFIRKPLYVDAVRITPVNFNEISTWCQGEQQYEPSDDPTKPGKKYIKVRVHNPKNIRQSKAFVGDWLLYTERGYKVYTNKAFHAAFDKVESTLSGSSVCAEEVEFIPATTQTITEAKIHSIEFGPVSTPTNTIESAPEQETVEPSAVEGKRVLSLAEQQTMNSDEIRELVQSGEAVLAQDIA